MPPRMTAIVKLKNETPVAHGARRLVFRHPDNPRLIIKVLRPEYWQSRWGNPSWRQRRKRYRHLTLTFHEVREHLAACAAAGRPPRNMQNIVGFAETDLGYGVVYEAVFGPDGNYAPTLKDLVLRGEYTPEIERAVEAFRRWLVRAPIVVGDLRPENVVCGRDEDGAPCFVVIDGIGDKLLVPLNGWIPWLNRRHAGGRLRGFDRNLQRLLADRQAT